MLGLEADLEIIGEAQDGRQAVSLVKSEHPDVVLMDISMPLLNGLEATRQALKFAPTTKIIVLSAHSDDVYVQNATAAGAVGFLLKQASTNDVCLAIREVCKGKVFFSPAIARRQSRLLTRASEQAGATKIRTPELTSREMEVLQLIAEGKANKESACELGIGIKTVEKHREHLMEKLDLHDTASLTRYAISTGVIESRIL